MSPKFDDKLFNQHRWEDHNLLIELNEKVKAIANDISEMKDNMADRLKTVEHFNELMEKRINSLENWRYYVVGITLVILPILGYLSYILIEHLSKP